MKILLLLMLSSLPILIFAQKIDVKENIITVDDIPYAKIEEEGHGMFQERTITISDLSNKPAIVIKYYSTIITAKKMPSNPTGTVFFADFSFLQSKQKGQIQGLPTKVEKVAKKIVKAKLFKDGKIDEESVDNFVLINSVVFTKN